MFVDQVLMWRVFERELPIQPDQVEGPSYDGQRVDLRRDRLQSQ